MIFDRQASAEVEGMAAVEALPAGITASVGFALPVMKTASLPFFRGVDWACCHPFLLQITVVHVQWITEVAFLEQFLTFKATSHHVRGTRWPVDVSCNLASCQCSRG